jgi:hypothetical protein
MANIKIIVVNYCESSLFGAFSSIIYRERLSIFWDYYVGSEILNQPLYHLLGIGLVGVGEAAVLGGDEMADEAERMLQLGNDTVFIVLMRVMIASRDVGTAYANAIQC